MMNKKNINNTARIATAESTPAGLAPPNQDTKVLNTKQKLLEDREVLQVGDLPIKASEIIPRLTRYRMLPQFLSEIIIDRAIATLSCSQEEIANAQEQFRKKNQITDGDRLSLWCQRNFIRPEEIESLVIRALKIEKFKQTTWGHKLKSYFLERKEELDRVSYSMIRLKDGGLARELYYRLEEGEQSFAEIAREYSLGPEATSGGLVGPMPMNMPHPIITRMLKISQPGRLWQPTRIEQWIVIVRMEKLIPAQLNQQMRDSLLNELFNRWLSEQVHQLSDRYEESQKS